MKKSFFTVALTLLATAVFAHHNETEKDGDAEQKIQNEQKTQEELKAQKGQDTEAIYCRVEGATGRVYECYICNCANFATKIIMAEKDQ